MWRLWLIYDRQRGSHFQCSCRERIAIEIISFQGKKDISRCNISRISSNGPRFQELFEYALNHGLKVKTPIAVTGVSISKFEQLTIYSPEAIPVGLPKRSIAQRKPSVDMERRSSR